MVLRVLASVVLLLSVLYLPFWVSVILALGAMIYFPAFWEAAVIFLISDALYGAPTDRFFGFTFASFTFALALLGAAEILKRKLRFYA